MPAAFVAAALIAPPTPAEPIVVADRRIAVAELDDRAARGKIDSRHAQPTFYRNADPLQRASDEATEQRWIEGEAGFRRLKADPRIVAVAVAAEQAALGGEKHWREALAPETPAQARARLANDVMRATVGQEIARRTRGARAFGHADLIVVARAIQKLAWRAQRSAAGQAIR